MSAALAARRRKTQPQNLKLRRLTQAYLTPYQHVKPHQITTESKIDHIYAITQNLILDYQSVTTGLFPRYSRDRDIGYVKDSIYCALACWACSIAYKRLDDERGRQTELRQTAVKTMRGILFCWMQQSGKLNAFKSNISAENSLHARFDLHSGMTLNRPHEQQQYGHMQMDLVALYLLALTEMIASGAKVIYTHHEVNFIQNLVFYIERTYRTPDFGMWERGTRYNNGRPELHASSLGMVKAALEAINGFNLYGTTGNSASVIYVDIDGHNRNRTTFETILPRESNSKNTDAALLMTVGWPAFASHDESLIEKTMSKCIRRLEGKFGVRRFLRDGYRCELEDHTRAYYEEHETSRFDGIECQFPMFFVYMSLTAYFRGDQAHADKYFDKLQGLLVNDDNIPGGLIVPECYCVDECYMDRERAKPNSTELYPFHDGAIYQGSMEGDPVVQIALIAESGHLQMKLSTYGISCQTPREVEPVQIWPSWRMVKLFECLGRDEKLGLSGRPPRPFGPLSTSKVFRVFGDTVLCYPLLFEVKDFYVSSDPAVLIDDIKAIWFQRDIEFVSRRWKLAGRPTMCLLLREENVIGEYFDHILDLLVQLKNGHVNGIRVRMGRVHQLLNTGCIEHIDFANSDDVEFDIDVLEETEDSNQLLSKMSLRDGMDDDATIEKEVQCRSDDELIEIIRKDDVDKPRQLAFALAAMWMRRYPDWEIDGYSVRARMERIYRKACQLRLWWLVRYCAGRLRKAMNSLAPAITNMLVRGKQVTLGVRGVREEVIRRPISPGKLVDLLFACCPQQQPHVAVIHQELIIACSDLMSHSPSAFDGVLTIRLSWLADAITLLLNYVRATGSTRNPGKMMTPATQSTTGIPAEFKKNCIYDLSPTIVKDVVAALMTRKNWHLLTPLQTRRLNGALNRMPVNFYDRVWTILERSRDGIVIASQFLPQQPTLSDMTEFELTFSYKIEEMLSRIAHPEYRQLLVELLSVVATILERNPEVSFMSGPIDCDVLIKKAFYIYADQENISNKEDLTPFYQLENVSALTSTATYLTKRSLNLVFQKMMKCVLPILDELPTIYLRKKNVGEESQKTLSWMSKM
ncbi:phosphorylase kinase alpha/beta [Necator americanus]|uniref:Phosphorylase b kinase regulatory subunit n=1 Tax=Necator americanus TaxID=51031 RepID=W2TBQ4_NECAM|nr:phosphorylase kinase alpha/beta [Necator americanus]ETN79480.1 phosphorylase kinase alpha/beta [Necator americanus]